MQTEPISKITNEKKDKALVEKFLAWMSKKRNIIENFIVQKLKSKHTSLKKYTNWAKLSHVTQDLEFTSWPTSCGSGLNQLDNQP